MCTWRLYQGTEFRDIPLCDTTCMPAYDRLQKSREPHLLNILSLVLTTVRAHGKYSKERKERKQEERKRGWGRREGRWTGSITSSCFVLQAIFSFQVTTTIYSTARDGSQIPLQRCLSVLFPTISLTFILTSVQIPFLFISYFPSDNLSFLEPFNMVGHIY